MTKSPSARPSRDRVYMFVRNLCTHDARVLKEARTLAEAGYEVTVIALHGPGLAEREQRGGFEIVRVPVDPVNHRILWWYWGLPERAKRFMRRGRERFQPEPTQARSSPAESSRAAHPSAAHPTGFVGALRSAARGALVAVYRLNQKILLTGNGTYLLVNFTRNSFSVVRQDPGSVYHAHDLNTLLPALYAARRTGGRVVYDSHELNLEAGDSAYVRGPRKWFLVRYEAFLIKRAARVITVNESIAGALEERYDVPRPAVVMNCPLPSEVTEGVLRQKLGFDGGVRMVLYQGGMTPDRGLPELLRAVPHLREDAAVVFMGDGKLRAELESLAAHLGIGERVRFLDAVPQDELLAHTASADVGVIPYQNASLNNYFSTPNKIFEYLMAGVPVAASEFPELARIIAPNHVGALFDPTDPLDIARAIDVVLGAPDADEMRSRARTLALTRYSWTVESKVLLGIYRELMPLA